MIISTVVDPEAFNEKQTEIPDYKFHAVSFLMGLIRNGIMVVDPQNRLLKELTDNIEKLPTSKGQRIQIALQEFLKRRKRIIKCKKNVTNNISDKITPELILNIAHKCKVDAAIVNDIDGGTYYEQMIKERIVPILDYEYSELERQRKWLDDDFLYVDQLSKTDFKNLIVRTVKFAKWIKIYDKQIGKGSNTKGWFKGLDFILSCWKSSGYFESDSQAKVEIFTCEAEKVPEKLIESKRAEKIKGNKLAAGRVMSEIIRPLRKNYPWPIEIVFKRDRGHIFHPRHLRTQSAAVYFDRGFDLFERSGKIRRNMVKLDNRGTFHFNEVENLPNAL